MKQLAIISGGFDPIHPGHVSLLQEAADQYGEVLVILNSDAWLARKKGRPFMAWEDRAAIIRGLRGVREVIPVDDGDGTVCNAIYKAKKDYWDHRLVFCNGGDRMDSNTPEGALCEALGIDLAWGIGGGKVNSSSTLLSRWSATDTHCVRPWGEWVSFRNFTTSKLKELVVKPGEKLSFQKHTLRDEFWFVASGTGAVLLYDSTRHDVVPLEPHSTITVPRGTWHQLRNTGETNLHVVEIQHGDLCIEEDIERWPDHLANDFAQVNLQEVADDRS